MNDQQYIASLEELLGQLAISNTDTARIQTVCHWFERSKPSSLTNDLTFIGIQHTQHYILHRGAVRPGTRSSVT
jgi:hypothetical protein